MTRIAVISDTHGNKLALSIAEERIKTYDYLIHAGDGEGDVSEFRCYFPEGRIITVSGNCDIRRHRNYLLEIEGVKIFVAHGDIYGVKEDRDRFVEAAIQRGAQIAIYGHTHIPDVDIVKGIYVLNPGSIGKPQLPYARTFGVIVLNDGKIDVHTEVV